MNPIKDSLIDLTRYASQLELDIKGLQRALKLWRTWDAQYEALKEAIEEAEEGDHERVRNEFEIELMDDEQHLVRRKEVDEVIGEPGKRTKDQMVNILDRRIDYVTRNIAQLGKEYERAISKRDTAAVISQPDEITDEDGQPITEILEELDEDGNVVSYKLNRPAHNMSHVVEALKKAGVEDVPEVEGSEPIKLPSAQGPQGLPDAEPRQIYKPSTKQGESSKQGPIPKKAPKKGVSFAEDTKPESEAGPSKSRTATRVENIMQSAKEQAVTNPTIPEDEDPMEAQLRRDMLHYSMNEVGAVVGEMQLEEVGTDDEDWGELDGWEQIDTDDEDEAEDGYGRNGRVVTEDYTQRMLELERKLGIQSRFTQDSRADTDGDADPGSDDERVGRIVVNHKSDAPSNSTATNELPVRPKETGDDKKKGVRFADNLDVSEAAQQLTPQPVNDSIIERESKIEPMSDLVVERDPSTRNANTKSNRKPSRFVSAKTKIPDFGDDATMKPYGEDYGKPQPSTRTPSNKTTPPFGPPDSTLSDNLVERDYVSMSLNDFMDVDEEEENDVDVDFRELASMNQSLRRKFIQREGGFLKEDENPIQPLDEEEGGPPRQSRFKAARLSKQ